MITEYVSEIVVIITIVIFFVKISMSQNKHSSMLGELINSSDNTKLYQKKIEQDIIHSKEDSKRQQILCTNHNSSLAEILRHQNEQHTDQKYMRDMYKDLKRLTINTNDAITNNTAVLTELLIVLRERK